MEVEQQELIPASMKYCCNYTKVLWPKQQSTTNPAQWAYSKTDSNRKLPGQPLSRFL